MIFKFLKSFLYSCLCMVLFYSNGLFAEESRIVIMSSLNNEIGQQVLNGFQIAQSKMSRQVKLIQDTGVNISPPPNLVVIMGNQALESAHMRFPDTQQLACLILDKNHIQNSNHETGIVLEHNIKDQLSWYRKFLPQSKRIGVLYSPEHNAKWVKQAELEAKRQGLKLVSIAVNSAHELPASLKAIKRNADAILAIKDPVVYSGKTAKAVLLFTFRNRIPFIGLSKAWVKAGALYALDWDYISLGEQCAGIADSMLSGKTANKIPLQKPEKINLIINMKTATYMKMSIKQSLIDDAAQVFE